MAAKPLILGMGPSRSHPNCAWHPAAHSTGNLCRLITGNAADLQTVERHFELADLNLHWHRSEELGDVIDPSQAVATLTALIGNGRFRGGRRLFLLGEQVTNFTFAFLRRPESRLARDAWRRLPKCKEVRLSTADAEARLGASLGYYDLVAIPVWHPRILLDAAVCMPPGWQQQMTNALRAAGGLPLAKFRSFVREDAGRRIQGDPQSPAL